MSSVAQREEVEPVSALTPAVAAALRELTAGACATRLVDGDEQVAVLLSPARYDELLDAAARLDLIEALNEAEDSLASGRVIPHEEVLPLLRRWAEESE